ncbi:MAG: hypothetical protein R8G34_08460 [Paracoccaceae bacterium]|nr:hypothetical protein [Paracoccaceae bacterium]
MILPVSSPVVSARHLSWLAQFRSAMLTVRPGTFAKLKMLRGELLRHQCFVSPWPSDAHLFCFGRQHAIISLLFFKQLRKCAANEPFDHGNVMPITTHPPSPIPSLL